MSLPERTATGGAVADVAREQPCAACHTRPGTPCTDRGDHLARYCDAQKNGTLTRRQLAAVITGLDVIAKWVIVPAVPPVEAVYLHRGCGGRVCLNPDGGGVCSCCWAGHIPSGDCQLVVTSS